MDSNDKLYGILSYIGILWLVPVIAGAVKTSEFAKFHANQGVVLFIFEVAVSIAAGLLNHIPLLGLIISLVLWAADIFLLVLAIMGIVAACQGQTKKLPLIGEFSIIK